MSDQFFTPPSVAKSLVSFLRKKNEECIADFAAGDGELLRAAQCKWPDARFVATDIDRRFVGKLRRRFPSWSVGNCDFLSQRSRNACNALRELKSGASLILLNPPFTCRGSKTHCVEFGGAEMRCSTAMAFVLNSLSCLSIAGRLVAVMPASSLTSQKDSRAWRVLSAEYSIRTIATYDLTTFNNCAANTIVVRLRRGRGEAKVPSLIGHQSVGERLRFPVAIIRGCVPMHVAKNGLAGPPFGIVHTTDLRGRKLTSVQHSIREKRRSVIGPAVLIPRVGRPSIAKCVLYLGRKPIVLSDCVYALRCNSSQDAMALRERMINAMDMVSSHYHGTCAPYLTVRDLSAILGKLGVSEVSVDLDGASP